MGVVGKIGKGLGRVGQGARSAGIGNGQALGRLGQVGKGVAKAGMAAVQAAGGPQGVMNIVSQSLSMGGQDQAAAITGQVVSMLQGLMQNQPSQS